MDLSQYANTYLDVGDHRVVVKSHRLFRFNSGSNGVEFLLANANGATVKLGFALTAKAYYRLANFAKACGFADLENYDHDALHGREVWVRVVRNGKYAEVDADNMAWWPIGATEAPPQQAPKASRPGATSSVATSSAAPNPDDDVDAIAF